MRRSYADSLDAPPWRRVDANGSITLRVHAQPGAKLTEVVGVHGDSLKIRLAAPAVEGKANEALIAFLAESFGVARRNVEIVRGQSARRKTLVVTQPAVRPDREWESL